MKQFSVKKSRTSSQELEKFQLALKKLAFFCEQVFFIFNYCNKQGFLNGTLIKDLEEITQSIQLQQFRVAVIGNFSQGKSTLINALVRKKIQPTRAIPCNGIPSLLKYGLKQRIICYYRDGTEKKISFKEYQQKIAIDKNLVLKGSTQVFFENSNLIQEIIFEHPNLELCKNGVTIIDSPVLNEHPDRIAIIQQMLKDVDAIIFLTDAFCPLTQEERELIQELKPQLNTENLAEPVTNLFVVVNKWDLLQEETRQTVKQKIEKTLFNQSVLIVGDNRIHFLSAQKALDAIFNKTENNYLKEFKNFTQVLERFLAIEKGSLKIKQIGIQINCLIEAGLEELNLEEKAKVSKAEKQKIIEAIGQVSGCDVRIRLLAKEVYQKLNKQIFQAWNKWLENLEIRLGDKTNNWSSKHGMFFSQKALIKDYQEQFLKNLIDELSDWESNNFISIVKENIIYLESKIQQEIKKIEAIYNFKDNGINSSLKQQIKIEFSEIKTKFVFKGLGYGVGGLGSFVFLLLAPIALPELLVIVASSIITTGISIFTEIYDEKKETYLKKQVFEMGWKNFNESSQEILSEIDKIIKASINNRVEIANKIIEQALFCYENILAQQIKVHQEDLEHYQIQKALIEQKSQELQEVNNQIKKFLNQLHSNE